ncbi:MAG: hypothetical protein IPN10_16185 [Saprospiraceae bacterium]|nr:hypothetical protein [Saprospiraceae bacterium]
MHIKTTFILLLSIYVISVIINSLKSNGNVGHFSLPLILMGFLFLSYSALSVFLTIKINKIGSFDWISSNPSIRNIALFFGMMAILYAFFNAIMIKLDWSTYQYQSIAKVKDLMAYTAYIWVPLLMIIPFGLFIYQNGSPIHTGQSFRLPLMLNVFIGCALYMYFNFDFLKYIITRPQSEELYHNKQTLENIHNCKKVTDILYYTRVSNEKVVVDSAMTKIKSFPDWEKQLSDLLGNCHPADYYWPEVYHFLSTYSVENIQTMVEPFGESITCLTVMVTNLVNNEATSPNDLNSLNLDKMLSSIEYQFSDHYMQFDNQLVLLSKALLEVKRNDFKEKTGELVKAIESCRKKFIEIEK